ncbi:formin-like protein 3 isoform X2 [Iris pallida]|uniref:Formin-like protein 3 isoform X2 n=1 Tax=Iris pallida TaxID=29817 RepID=A0AAX6E543_IRIPA|nr:formin-like protein 3 isoform X2 [Iris pallida]
MGSRRGSCAAHGAEEKDPGLGGALARGVAREVELPGPRGSGTASRRRDGESPALGRREAGRVGFCQGSVLAERAASASA